MATSIWFPDSPLLSLQTLWFMDTALRLCPSQHYNNDTRTLSCDFAPHNTTMMIHGHHLVTLPLTTLQWWYTDTVLWLCPSQPYNDDTRTLSCDFAPHNPTMIHGHRLATLPLTTLQWWYRDTVLRLCPSQHYNNDTRTLSRNFAPHNTVIMIHNQWYSEVGLITAHLNAGVTLVVTASVALGIILSPPPGILVLASTSPEMILH